MKPFFIVSICTVLLLICIYMLNLNLLQLKELPLDDEQTGIDEQIIIHFSHVVAENTPKGVSATKFAELVKAKTNGQVVVQVYPNGILFNDDNEFEALKNNDVQMIAPTFSKISSIFPAWEVLDLPFLIEKEEQLQQVLNSELKTVLFEDLQKHDIHGLQFWSNGFKQIAANKPVLYADDFHDLQIRVMNSERLRLQMEMLGATPVITSFDDVFNIMENNEINSQENTISNLYSKGFHTFEKHITLSNHGIMGYAVLMNGQFWRQLSPEHQVAITEALTEMQQWQFNQSMQINSESLAALQAIDDVKIYVPTVEQLATWKEQISPIYESYRENGHARYYSILLKELNEQNRTK